MSVYSIITRRIYVGRISERITPIRLLVGIVIAMTFVKLPAAEAATARPNNLNSFITRGATHGRFFISSDPHGRRSKYVPSINDLIV